MVAPHSCRESSRISWLTSLARGLRNAKSGEPIKLTQRQKLREKRKKRLKSRSTKLLSQDAVRLCPGGELDSYVGELTWKPEQRNREVCCCATPMTPSSLPLYIAARQPAPWVAPIERFAAQEYGLLLPRCCERVLTGALYQLSILDISIRNRSRCTWPRPRRCQPSHARPAPFE